MIAAIAKNFVLQTFFTFFNVIRFLGETSAKIESEPMSSSDELVVKNNLSIKNICFLKAGRGNSLHDF